MSDEVLIERAGGVLTLTLNRTEKKNALKPPMYHALIRAFAEADADPAVRVILLQANGDMFTAGNDVGEFASINARAAEDDANAEPPAATAFLRALPKLQTPLIAAVHGRSIGVGLTMLLHCDMVFVAEDALLSSPFVNLAIVPEAASSMLLPAVIGHQRAFQLFALGESIDGRTAAAWGIANAALPAGEVQAKARAAAEALAQRPPSAVRITKSLMRNAAALSEHVEKELELLHEQVRSPEAAEAFAAFFEKRKPDFSKF